ncbi:PPIC-type PPIASE family protein [Hoeflea sp. IMCC20628]|uniref:peptidylprolyl isomerase n=1 Tax=Hoeflea sp. IMCC20628 TaxID=1620421 RepID=UPI00063B0984|nr:peptidylprolyl isomerase [Hoeflea sp. IMCC20628]AKI00180.1 PPIC-type PPIASE family protein [Hoeflea sp. IMCC20628]
MKQTFTDISVNGEAISPELIATEAQNHPAPKGKPGMAWMAAARALAVRTLILQEAKRRNLEAAPSELAPGLWETEEEAIIRQVLDEAVEAETPTPQAVRAAYDANLERHRAPSLFEAAHILFAARPDDVVARKVAKDQANAVLAKIKLEPKAFDALARDHSACSSRANGGRLGQISAGDTVAEFEAALKTLAQGEIAAEPVESRYGFHIIRLDARADGEILPFEAVETALRSALEKAAWVRASRVFVDALAEQAEVTGITLKAA